MLTKRIVSVQKQVEGRNFDMRKHVLEYDDVLDQHRKIIYTRRKNILENFDEAEKDNAEIDKLIEDTLREEAQSIVARHTDEEGLRRGELTHEVKDYIGEKDKIFTLNTDDPTGSVFGFFKDVVDTLRADFADRNFDQFQRRMYLSAIDQLWMTHIDRMANLREEVAFEGYAQRQPLIVYKEKAYEIFMEMMNNINHKVTEKPCSSMPW